ncbi:MAG: TetR/AcrR family transcriptional regulator [Gemmatimonadetes bacterium]|nr:TetR/AcrR family transcriptional regulator [Gemmatimonadota bacterium]
MVPRVTQAHLDARRVEILTAAFRCFSRKGLHGTTMQEIADEAALSAGAIYRYFDGKEALIEALAEESAARRSHALRALEPGGGAEALADAVANMMAGLDSRQAEVSVRLDVRLWAEALDHAEVRATAREAFASVREPVAEYVRDERDAERMRADIDPDAMGNLVISLLTGIELQRALEEESDLDAYRATVRALLTGAGGDPRG